MCIFEPVTTSDLSCLLLLENPYLHPSMQPVAQEVSEDTRV
jgi:hypothetical protein